MTPTLTPTAPVPAPVSTPAPLKAVIWDLDNTLWEGVLTENGAHRLRPGVADTVRRLDELGILQSVASRNDPAPALAALTGFGLADYFLAPQINWGAKSESVRRIAAALNLHPESFLFVDDDPFERAEVHQSHPRIQLWDPADDVAAVLTRPQFTSTEVTAEGSQRRALYRSELVRAEAEREFTGTPPQFLASLDLRLTIRRAGPQDLARAEELTVRTHQLNATGYTYSAAELDVLRSSRTHTVLVAELSDRFGDYGIVGVVLVEQWRSVWTLKLLLASCRVMSRGVGGMLLAHVVERAHTAGARLFGEFVPTDRNRQMLVAYRFAGFRQTPTATPAPAPASTPAPNPSAAPNPATAVVLEHNGTTIPPIPTHVHLTSDF
ncbi:HAD-IIIC family phosphatase [Streptacidiphilus cavernicola]|uniref:HAD-IIIC family phosphatase n=1 Tax=Streptacidiphilus cavernicola TaxID=3342716 RepID=A0ABV6W6B9_9ACTN